MLYQYVKIFCYNNFIFSFELYDIINKKGFSSVWNDIYFIKVDFV